MTDRTALSTLEPGLAGSLDKLDPTNLALAGFLARYRGNTLATYKHHLAVFLGWCAQNSVTPLMLTRPHVELYLRWLEQQGWSESTVAGRFGVVCSFYKTAHLDEIIDRDPTVHIAKPVVHLEAQRRTFLKPLEFAQFLSASRDEGPMAHALVCLLGMSGLRIGEATSLRIETMTVKDGYDVLHFIGKGSKPAEVPLPVPVMRAVREAIGVRTSGPLLLTRRHTPMDRSAARRMITKIAVAAKVNTAISPHSLRRSFCTSGLVSGVPIYDMQLAMRHSNPKTTAIYDMAAKSFDRNASHRVAAYLAGMTG